jgi:hypothetical protein
MPLDRTRPDAAAITAAWRPTLPLPALDVDPERPAGAVDR